MTLIPSPRRSPRRKLTKRQKVSVPLQHGDHPPPLPTKPHRAPPLTAEQAEARRALHSVELTEEDKEYIYQKMQGRAWRRRAYIWGNLALWASWLVTFREFVVGTARKWNLADCLLVDSTRGWCFLFRRICLLPDRLRGPSGNKVALLLHHCLPRNRLHHHHCLCCQVSRKLF